MKKHYKKRATLLELIRMTSDYCKNENELVAVIKYLVNSGRVRLTGNFKGSKIE